MTPEEVEALIAQQQAAYDKASERFGVGKHEAAIEQEALNMERVGDRGARRRPSKQADQ